MSVFQIKDRAIHSDDPALPDLLASIYAEKIRPLCLCRTPGIEMYVAKVGDKYIIKRMPNSGIQHAPACDSFEPPPELSGLGQVVGSAIQENPDEGTVALKLNFSLSKIAGRAAPTPSGKESDSVKTDGNKLTLRSTLHYLWEEAGFNRWAPAMANKRNWYVIRKYLLRAAEDKTTKGASLAEMLYIPETFRVERKDEITQNRIAKMGRIAAPEKGTRHLMLVIGEVKEIAQARYGHKAVFKHLPDFHFMLNEDLYKRLQKRFDVELSLWDGIEQSHLMMIATFSVGVTGIAAIEEAALMCVSEHWIPIESTYDYLVLNELIREHRRFLKGMRYNLPSSRPLSYAVLSDTEPPTALYIVPPGIDDDYMDALADLVDKSELPSWLWRAGEESMPALPGLPAPV